MLRDDSASGLAHYLSDATSAIANIHESLRAVGRSWSDATACLDLPCGYGRVTRHLVRHLDRRRITASDIDRQGVRFCVAEFGVEGLQSRRDVREVRFPRHYDLIFVGSLLTHLPPPQDDHVLEALARVLHPGGILIFTTQGLSCLDHLGWYGEYFAKLEASFRRQVENNGKAHVPYPGHDGYGITIHPRGLVERRMQDLFQDSMKHVRFAERGWDAHQDVWAFQRS